MLPFGTEQPVTPWRIILVPQTTRLYDAERQQLRATHSQPQAVLDTCFEDDSAAFSAGLESTIQRCGASNDRPCDSRRSPLY